MNDNQRVKHFTSQLNKALQESDLKMADIIKKIGIVPATFYAWRKGKILPRLSSLKKLAQVFGKDVAWFIGSWLFLIQLD
ncbi:helix-turn-helix transcriptional regulator [Oenococcus sicerae]|uniref:Helix-turn-helix transcriptional regulator n=1 Tax=Oenococcus sicerae TaxID=2203724 RepID=A0ABX5QN82_9LACO|nr:helix-turn-helix transcriptional regulator [Oenococcus sicerae]QAS70228.1 helix-turn-helix transcriptional regulator [Oenococcus sicerae]